VKAIKIEIDRTILAGIKIGLAIIIITLLAACQSVSSGIPYIPKKPIETKTSNPIELYEPITETTATSSNPKTKEVVIVRSILNSNQNLPIGDYSYIYFHTKPYNKDLKTKQLKICEAWQASFNNKKEIINALDFREDVDLHTLYWLDKRLLTNSDICSDLLANYDYSRALITGTRLKINTRKTQIVTKLGNEVLVVNLSNIKDQDIDKVINIWHDKVCNPIVTSKEIKLVSLLDAFKAALGALGKIVKIQ
jgi:hypothetical protein